MENAAAPRHIVQIYCNYVVGFGKLPAETSVPMKLFQLLN